MVVYIDVLLFVNLVLNALLLAWVARVLHLTAVRWRLGLAAALGSLFSLTILAPPLPFALALLLKVAGAAAMCLAAFSWRGVRALAKSGVCLFAASSLVAGAAAALSGAANGSIVQGNLSVYIGVSPLLLVGAALVCYLGMAGFELLFGRPRAVSRPVTATVSIGKRSANLAVLIDSGSSLCEPLTGKPVLLLDARHAPRLLDEESLQAVREGFSAADGLAGVFAIPYSSVGGDGLLVGFGGASIVLTGKEPRCRDGLVAAFCGHIEGADAVLPLFSLEE